jgi:hypothetical protein
MHMQPVSRIPSKATEEHHLDAICFSHSHSKTQPMQIHKLNKPLADIAHAHARLNVILIMLLVPETGQVPLHVLVHQEGDAGRGQDTDDVGHDAVVDC